MNPRDCAIALRPRTPMEVFDLLLAFFRDRPWPFVKLVALTVLPVWLPLWPLSWMLGGNPLLLLVPWLVSAPLQALFTILAGRMLFARTVPLRVVFRQLLESSPQLVAAWVFQAAGLALTTLTCGLLLLPVQASQLYLTETALLERVSAVRGNRRSSRLMLGHAGIAFFGVLARYGMLAWWAVVGEAMGHFIVGTVLQLGTPFGTILDGHVTPYLLGGLLLAQPVEAVYRLMLYVDVRTRLEGWDLQVGFLAAGARG